MYKRRSHQSLAHDTENGHQPEIRRAGSTTTLTPAPPDEGEPALSDLPTSSPRVNPARLATAPYSAEYELADLDLGHSDHATYSSLPPSPRGGKFDYDYSHRLQLDLDLEDVLARLEPDSSPRVGTNRRRLSLDSASAHESERELEEVEQFWPARSRRQTLDSSQVPPPISPSSATHSVEPELRDESEAASEDRGKTGLSIWDLLRDEDAAEQWEGWIADGKW